MIEVKKDNFYYVLDEQFVIGVRSFTYDGRTEYYLLLSHQPYHVDADAETFFKVKEILLKRGQSR